MSAKNPSDFAEVWTHEGARGIVEDVLRTHGRRIGAKICKHRYDSAKPDGVVMVLIEKNNTTQLIRYGLPDDAEELRKLAVAALEPSHLWKSQHERV